MTKKKQIAEKRDQQNADLLDAFSMVVTYKYVCETTRDNNWECDQWLATLKNIETNSSFTVDYYTGLGHREYGSKSKQKINGKWYQVDGHEDKGKPLAPKPLDLLYSIMMDSDACDQSFDDWCDSLGYDTDSRKALETYLACQEQSTKFRRTFPGVDLREYAPLEDY